MANFYFILTLIIIIFLLGLLYNYLKKESFSNIYTQKINGVKSYQNALNAVQNIM